MPKNFDKLVKDYLSDLEATYNAAVKSGQGTPELSYRPALHKFLQELAVSINADAEAIFEPRKQGNAGRPDWRFFDRKSFGIFGYVEAKGIDANSVITPHEHLPQIEKYLKLGSEVILTDGIDFIFFNDLKNPETISLIKKPLGGNWKNLPINTALEVRFRKFFDTPSFRRGTEYDLVRDVARLAKQIAEAVLELADQPPEAAADATERQTITALNNLKKVLEEHHDPELKTPQVFADFVAQVLSFGLLYAHRVIAVEDTPSEKLKKIKDFWKRTTAKFDAKLRPFRVVMEILDEELESTGGIGSAFRELMLILAHFELSSNLYDKPDYHILYENFLESYDKDTKDEFGAFYTPPELTDYTVRLTETLVKSNFSGVSIYDADNKIIDPCCGTGTFLESLIKHAPDGEITAEITGFEILPAPYALTHYRMAMLHKSPSPSDGESVGIILTNTLRDEITNNELMTEKVAQKTRNELPIQLSLLWEEQEEAQKSSRPPLTLVIGNPPSSERNYGHATGGGFKIIDKLMEDFRPPKGERTARSNTQQQLKNPFIKFLRWACAKVETRPGVIAFILPESFAVAENFFYARKWLVERFPKLWLLDIDKDLRTGEAASNLFKTQQGRLLLVAMTSPDESGSGGVSVNYRSISSLSKTEKKSYLNSKIESREILRDFRKLSVSESNYSLRPAKESLKKGYDSFWAIRPKGNEPQDGEAYVFGRQCSAVKLAPSSLFVHVNSGILVRRSSDAGKLKSDAAAFIDKWFEGQSKPPGKNKLTNAVMENLAKAAKKPSSVIDYSYRPFLTVSILLAEEALQSLTKMKNSGTRTRPELEKAFEKEETIGIAIAPSPKDIGKLHRFAAFCWNLPDNDLCARQNARVLCNYFPEYKTIGREWNSTPILNVNSVLIENFTKNGEYAKAEIAEAMVFYSYAVLSSNVFLSSFEGELHRSADSRNPLRIPIAGKADVFMKIAGLGRRIAELERSECNEPFLEHYEKSRAEYVSEFKLNSYKVESDKGHIRLSESKTKGVKIENIPSEVLSCRVAGHEVVKQWLKWHSFNYSRVAFSEVFFHQFLQLLSNVERQLKVIKDADKEIEKMLVDANSLLPAA